MGPFAAALAALARKIKEEDAQKLEDRNGVAECRTPDKSDPSAAYNNTERVCEPSANNNTPPICGAPAYNNTTPVGGPPPYNNTPPVRGPPPYNNTTPVRGSPPYNNTTPVRGPPPYNNAAPIGEPLAYNNTTPVRGLPPHNNTTPIGGPAAYNNAEPIGEPPAYAVNYYGLPFLPPPAMINHYTAAGFGPPPSAYAAAPYYHNRLVLMSPVSPEESDTDRESDSESSDSADSSDAEAFSTPVKSAAPNYMLEPYVCTPTTSHKRKIFRRRLNFHDPNVIYDLEDISEDECDDGVPIPKKPMDDDDIIVTENESMVRGNIAHVSRQKRIIKKNPI